MGNVWCCRPNSYIIDYTHRKVVISQGVQCSLLMPATYCSHACFPKPVCTPERHCRCGVSTASGDWKIDNCKENINKRFLNSPPITLKSKIQKSKETYLHEHHDALVSLSETFSESSLEEFLSRKRFCQNSKPNLTTDMNNKLITLPEIETSELLNSSFYKPINNSSEALVNEKFTKLSNSNKRTRRKNRTKKRRKNGKRNNLDSSSNNSFSTDNSLLNNKDRELKPQSKKSDLNNSSETTSIEDSKKTTDTMYSLVTPKKSILKNVDLNKEPLGDINENEKENLKNGINNLMEKQGSISVHSDKYSNGSIPHRSLSAMSNHDSLDQLMSLLKSSTFTVTDDIVINKPNKSKSNDCINKSVNFTTDVTELKQYNELQQKPVTKSGYQIQPDGKIKKRLILRETHKLFDILNDPNDRRIRAICDRYQCDLEIFVRPPKIGLMYFAVEILAPDKYSLRMCVRELDSSMKWCISSQLF